MLLCEQRTYIDLWKLLYSIDASVVDTFEVTDAEREISPYPMAISFA